MNTEDRMRCVDCGMPISNLIPGAHMCKERAMPGSRTPTPFPAKALPLQDPQGTLRAMVVGLVKGHADFLRTETAPKRGTFQERQEWNHKIESAARDLEDWAAVLESGQELDLSVLKKRTL